MKLNHDCVRDLLLYIEEHSSYDTKIDVNKLKFKNYSNSDLIYTADKLFEANYLNCIKSNQFNNSSPSIIIKSITYDGHQFLDNIRDDGVWKNTKSILSKFTSTSLGIISDISSQIISNIILKQLGLN